MCDGLSDKLMEKNGKQLSTLVKYDETFQLSEKQCLAAKDGLFCFVITGRISMTQLQAFYFIRAHLYKCLGDKTEF